MDDKFPDSHNDVVLQEDLGCVSVLPNIKFTGSVFFPSAPLWWDTAGLTESCHLKAGTVSSIQSERCICLPQS